MTGHTDVLIVGAGVVGAACALELARAGATVCVVDAGADWGAACSAGNAGLITPSRSLSLASLSNVAAGLRSMVSNDESFRLSPHRSLAGWLPRYLAACAGPGTVRRRDQLLRMGLQSAQLYQQWEDQQLTAPISSGLLHVYTRPDAWAEGLRVAERDRAAGLRVVTLTAEEAVELEPALSRDTVGALHYLDDSYCDPLAMTRALGRAAVAAGAEFRPDTEVLGWHRSAGRLRGVVTSAGPIDAPHLVLAAGWSSARLATLAGASLPIEPGKGYSLDVGADYVAPSRALLFPEGHCVVTPLGDRTRMTSKLELSGADFSVSNATIDSILRVASTGLQTHGRPTLQKVWRGMRPCSPDGLPFVGRLGSSDNLYAATGHGMLGVTMAPLTAAWIADLVLERPNGADTEHESDRNAVSPGRYGRRTRTIAARRRVAA